MVAGGCRVSLGWRHAEQPRRRRGGRGGRRRGLRLSPGRRRRARAAARPLLRRLRQLRRLRGQRARLGQGARARAAAGPALGRRSWEKLADASSPDDFEYDRKGSVVVAETEAELAASAERARVLAGLGVHRRSARRRRAAPRGAARRARPPGRRALSGRCAARAAAGHRRAGPRGGPRRRRAVAGHRRSSGSCASRRGRAIGVETGRRARSPPARSSSLPGVWTAALLADCGLNVPVTPRKGQIVVLERSPVVFRRKLSEAGYVAAVEADDAAPADRHGRRVHADRHGAARLQPPARRLRPRRGSLRRGRDRPPRRAVLPGLEQRPRAAGLRRAAPADARSHPDHRPVRTTPRTSAWPPATRAPASGSHPPRASSSRPGTPARRPPLPLAWFSPDRFAPVELAAS